MMDVQYSDRMHLSSQRKNEEKCASTILSENPVKKRTVFFHLTLKIYCRQTTTIQRTHTHTRQVHTPLSNVHTSSKNDRKQGIEACTP